MPGKIEFLRSSRFTGYGDIDDSCVFPGAVNGPDDFGDGEMTEDELNDVIEGDDEEMDRVINGVDPEEMSDEEFRRSVYGDDPPKRKRTVYRVAGSKERRLPPPTSPMLGSTY